MNVEGIVTALILGGFTNEDLNKISKAIVYARKEIGAEALNTFGPGDKVQFTNRGVTEVGTVVKVNRTKIQVKVGVMKWSVPANMLSAA